MLTLILIAITSFVNSSSNNIDSVKTQSNFHLIQKTKVVSLSPDFSLQYSNKERYNAMLTLLPGYEYFLLDKFSVGIKLGAETHIRQTDNEFHHHFGTFEELYIRKYFSSKHLSKKIFLFADAGINHHFRWNHYHDKPTGNNSYDIESHFRPFIETGLLYFINNKFALQAAMRSNLRYDATNNGKSYVTKPDFEMNYVFGINYLLN